MSQTENNQLEKPVKWNEPSKILDRYENGLKIDTYLIQLPDNGFLTVNEVIRMIPLKFKFTINTILNENLPLPFLLANMNKMVLDGYDFGVLITQRKIHYSYLKEVLQLILIRPPNTFITQMRRLSKNLILPRTQGGIEMCLEELKCVLWDFQVLYENPTLNAVFKEWLCSQTLVPDWFIKANIKEVVDAERKIHQEKQKQINDEIEYMPHLGVKFYKCKEDFEARCR